MYMGRASLSRGATQIVRAAIFDALYRAKPVEFIIRRSGAEQLCFSVVLHQPTTLWKSHIASLFLCVLCFGVL